MSQIDQSLSSVVSIPVVMRMNQVTVFTGLSRATIYRLMASGQFPCSFKIGQTASGWLASEIRSWINERAMSRQSADRSDRLVAA